MKQLNNFNANEKILKYPEKLDYFFHGHKTLIVTELDLTNRCNHLCPGCCGINENNAQLSWNQIEKIIPDLANAGNQGIILSGGGEPLMSPYFVNTIDLIKKTGMKIGLNSNGSIMNQEIGETIAKNCEYFRIRWYKLP